MKRFLIALSLMVALVLSSGCASWRNSVARDGSMFTSTRNAYVVINYSGGCITDVWVLANAFVESEKDSDGWLFIDSNGNPINVGGDAKVIRIINKSQLKNYREFHIEIDGGIYTPPGYKGVCAIPRDDELAGRYHLRKRVPRFFDRSRGSKRGSIRGRRRSVEPMEIELAGRYHLRNRTSDFFGRIG